MLYEFVLFDRPSVSLKWMGVIFMSCCSVISCHTLCHSELPVDRHCLKFHGRFVYPFVLPEAAGQVRHRLFLYVLFAVYQFNYSQLPSHFSDQPWGRGRSTNLLRRGPLPGRQLPPLSPLLPPTPPPPPPQPLPPLRVQPGLIRGH